MNFTRRYGLRLGLLILALAAIAAAGVILLGFPRLVELSPADGAVDVSSDAPLRLVFSRPMEPASVQARLRLTPAVEGSYTWEGDTLIFAPAKGWPSGAVIQVQLEAGAQAASFPALPVRQAQQASFTIWQPGLAFLYPAAGPANVYLYQPQAAENTPLTNAMAGVLDYIVAPDGRALYYSTPVSEGGSQIMRQPIPERSARASQPAGTQTPSAAAAPPVLLPQPQPALTCPQANCLALALSPNRAYLAYERTVLPGGEGIAAPQVWWVALDAQTGLAAGQPNLAGAPDHQTVEPLWSPDNRLTFYDSQAQAYIVLDPVNGKTVRFANQTGQGGDWQPDGAAFLAPEIFFLDPGTASGVSGLERLADSHLLRYDPRSGRSQDLTEVDGIEDASPAYSPDGAFLAFARKYLDTRRWTPGRQIWLRDLRTNQARPVTADVIYNHYDLKWSSTSDRLAFVRFNQSALNEPPEVWMLDLTSGNLQQVVVEGYAPQWLP